MFLLEKTNAKKYRFNEKTHAKYSWKKTIPWSAFGIDPSDGLSEQELVNLQIAVGVDADGLIGLGTLKAVQSYLKNEGHQWNPYIGQLDYLTDGQPHVLWNGLEIPLDGISYPVHTYASANAINLHDVGSFSTSAKDRNINSIVVHWGGLNPEHLGRVFSNRKASSHFAVGRSERTGKVEIFQYLDTAHIAWHGKGANKQSIGIDICQQPELKFLGYYKKNGYDVRTISNPAEGYGPSKIISLDSEIEEATTLLLHALSSAFAVPDYWYGVESGKVSKDTFAAGGVFSHFHVDFNGQGKWDVAPWWDAIIASKYDQQMIV